MSSETREVVEFLGGRFPFDQIPDDELEALSGELATRRFAPGAVVLGPEEPVSALYIIRRGAIEIRDGRGDPVTTLVAGELLGQDSVLGRAALGLEARAQEETLLHLLPAERFEALCRAYPLFRSFARPESLVPGRVAPFASAGGDGIALMYRPLSEIVTRAPVTVEPQRSIREAAQVMSTVSISSLLIVEDEQLVGILTDRDLRNRVIAAGRSFDDPVSTVMSPSPETIDASRQTHEALLAMVRSHYHHLPVTDGGRLLGMVTDTDLLRRHSLSPLFVIGDIHRAEDLDTLVRASSEVKSLLLSLAEANATADSIGRAVSSVGEAVSGRLLALAERELGPPPVPYAWLSGGSLARFEQTAHSDQDNCLLLADSYEPDVHGPYFDRLAERVCDGLAACGYVYCPGEIMAKTPRWRQPLAVWRRYFDVWIDEPQPKALMHACIFFDLRRLHGDRELFAELQSYVLDKAARNHIFHAFMASNALKHEPPLGFFRKFVLVKDGEHDRTLDLKHSGVIPVVDIARIYALVTGTAEVNTLERLEEAERAGVLSAAGGPDLRDALEFIASVRLRHQARQIRAGVEPDNFVSPGELSHFERSHLKDAFTVVRTIQGALSQRYQAHLR